MKQKTIRWLPLAAVLMLGLAACELREAATDAAFEPVHLTNAASKVGQKLE